MDLNWLIGSNATAKIAAIQYIAKINPTYKDKLNIDFNIFDK